MPIANKSLVSSQASSSTMPTSLDTDFSVNPFPSHTRTLAYNLYGNDHLFSPSPSPPSPLSQQPAPNMEQCSLTTDTTFSESAPTTPQTHQERAVQTEGAVHKRKRSSRDFIFMSKVGSGSDVQLTLNFCRHGISVDEAVSVK
ncbi:hypothetical protein NP233_g9785 [Leucocoprinus birnbaumii]|uniref:Uncharacterized protein n=1 Tax=Leucocoprinus birnbaumii TaxID=56174 RepID=A0AAD5VNB7_9AGAR|nr:hypothetical protein NP233_g9785 [Leucocoprinus birnbaumii]